SVVFRSGCCGFKCEWLSPASLRSPCHPLSLSPCHPLFRPPEEKTKPNGSLVPLSLENALLRLHPWSINVVVYHDPSGRIHLGRGLALRCFQRLSFPNIATQQCR